MCIFILCSFVFLLFLSFVLSRTCLIALFSALFLALTLSRSLASFLSSLLLCVAVIQCNKTADCVLYSLVALLWLSNKSTRAHFESNGIEWGKKQRQQQQPALIYTHTSDLFVNFLYTKNVLRSLWISSGTWTERKKRWMGKKANEMSEM